MVESARIGEASAQWALRETLTSFATNRAAIHTRYTAVIRSRSAQSWREESDNPADREREGDEDDPSTHVGLDQILGFDRIVGFTRFIDVLG